MNISEAGSKRLICVIFFLFSKICRVTREVPCWRGMRENRSDAENPWGCRGVAAGGQTVLAAEGVRHS